MTYQRGDEPEFQHIADRWQVARKRYICDACAEPILPDTRYYILVFKQDGEFGAVRQHDSSGYCSWS